MTSYASPRTINRSSLSSSNDLNVSSGMARKGLVLMMGLSALAAGCKKDAQAIRDEIASLPHVTPSEIVNSSARYTGERVAIEGKVTLVKDDSYTSTDTIMTPMIIGDMIICMPQQTTNTTTQLWYSIAPEKPGSGSLWVFSNTTLNLNTVVVAGKVKKWSDGVHYLEHQYSLYSAEGNTK